MFGNLKDEIIEIKGTTNKILTELLSVVKMLDVINDHSRRIDKLEDKMDRIERFIIEYKTKDCEAIKETDEITFQDLGEMMK
ncbi:MAG: hypothetical protein M0P71_17450 [Melioribacteraceae bacterium]|nr:hypothetical protein [Melioribacteraceae bacterium]